MFEFFCRSDLLVATLAFWNITNIEAETERLTKP